MDKHSSSNTADKNDNTLDSVLIEISDDNEQATQEVNPDPVPEVVFITEKVDRASRLEKVK